MGIDCKRFITQPVNGDFICSICEDVFENPVERRSCEHIYCHDCITRWLMYNPICPIDRERLTQSDLEEVPRVFKSLLGSLQVRCINVKNGCTQTVRLESLPVHEAECSHAPSSSSCCSNNCGFDGDSSTSHSCVDILKEKVRQLNVTIGHKDARIKLLEHEIEMQSRRRAQATTSSESTVRSTPSLDPNSAAIHTNGIEKLWRKGVIKSRVVFDSMMSFNLVHFYGDNAFKDNWAFGHARNLESIVPHLTPSLTKVLVNNNFSGYFQACLSKILGSRCKVFTVVDQSSNGIQILRTHYPHVLSSNRVVPITSTEAPNESPYSMIIDFSKEKVISGCFDRLATESAFIVNPWSPTKLRQRVHNEIRHVTFFSIFGEKTYRYSNHGSTRPLV